MKTKSKEINEIIQRHLFDFNNQETRNSIAYQISEVYGHEMKDCTTTEEIYKQLLSFKGIDPKTQKSIKLRINTNNPMYEQNA